MSQISTAIADATVRIETQMAVAAFSAPVQEAPKPKFCPNCGAPYEGGKFCQSCGSSYEVAEVEAFYAKKAAAAAPKPTCPACNVEVFLQPGDEEATYPYCGNPVVLAGHFAGSLKPDLVIPFQVDKKAAIAALNNHYKGKLLLPKVFKDQSHIEEVKGLYVPVWLFDADADADIHYRASRIRSWSDSEYRYTETTYYSVYRCGGICFENVPVDGSTKMEDTLMESIEPYDITGAVPFKAAYLPGYLADKYDVDAQASIVRANERIKRSTEEAFRSTVHGYTSVTTVDSAINLKTARQDMPCTRYGS